MTGQVVRTWMGVAAEVDAAAYLEHLQQDTIPHLKTLSGFERIQVLQRPISGGIQFRVSTTWRSIEVIHDFSGPKIDVAVVPERAQELLIRFDEHVEHYVTAIDE
jgi:hypothetical protein